MKARWIIVGLLLLNVGLAAALFSLRRAATPRNDSTHPEAAPIAGATSRPGHPSSVKQAGTITTNDFHWASVESEDYRLYIANMRAIGVPEETVRDIIIADVNKLFGRRLAGLYPSPEQFKFWQVEDRKTRDEERKREQQRRELEKEKRALIKELLGIDYETAFARWSGRPDEDSYVLGFLAPEKQQQLQALQSKYRELTRALWGDGSGERTPEMRAQLAALRTQEAAEMAQLLGPQDYEQYLLRNSPIARNMRDNLSAFQPTEDEFRKIFQLRKALEEQTGGNRGNERMTREQRQTAQQQLEQQLESTLGEERFAQYRMSQDDRYRSLDEFAQRSNVPRETVDAVYEMRRSAEEARRQVESNPALAPEVRQATLQALAEETKRSVSQSLGESAWTEYQRREGSWIDRLSRAENNRAGRGEPAVRGERERFLRR
jgi:hypothetical protein